MVRPVARRGDDDDLGPVTDGTGRVHGRTFIASFCDVRDRHSTSDIPCTPAPLGPGIYYNLGALGSSTQPPHTPVRTHRTIHTLPYPMRYMDLLSFHLSPYLHHMTRMHMLLLKYQQPLNEVSVQGCSRYFFFEQLVSGVLVDSSYGTADYTTTNYNISSSEPCHGRILEHEMVGSLHIGGEDDDSDEVENVPVAPVSMAHTSSTSVRPGPGKGKVIILSYIGHIASSIWRGQSDLGITYFGGGINIQELAQNSGLHATSSIYLEVHSSPIRVVTSSPPSCGRS
ncbi:hypothetical protein M9H77_04818 [Catharanthus roseus]|uniref:Uncharacterized protein n=1 Tax=Catharanthus roseus TaxID=4058 RepID=A0ACC0CFA4_CATRO|nr:hypothetical protein M9H77_04818 [Catharanthus roseus]